MGPAYSSRPLCHSRALKNNNYDGGGGPLSVVGVGGEEIVVGMLRIESASIL